MKKGTSKILAMLLAMTLIFTSAGVAFAGTESVVTETKSGTAVTVDDTFVKDVKVSVKKAAASKKSVKSGDSSFTFTTLKTGSDNEFDKAADNINEFLFNAESVLTDSNKGVSCAVKFPSKGTVTLAIAGYAFDATMGNLVNGYGLTYGLFYDQACTTAVDSTGYASSNGTDSTRVFNIPKGGTYYIGVYTTISTWSTAQCYYGALAAIYANGADRTLSNNTYSVVGQKNQQTNYLKFKATNNGYVTISTDNLYGTVTLMNSTAKTAYSNAITAYSSSNANITYGVKKGNTYTLKVVSKSNSDGMYRIKYSNKKITEKSGTKRTKAVSVSRNTTKKGFIAAGSSQADWYKIKVTKSTVKITLTGATNDKIVAKLYNSKGKAVSSSTASISRSGYNYYLKGTNMKKGTYYIKVYRGNSKSSGYYNLKWQ